EFGSLVVVVYGTTPPVRTECESAQNRAVSSADFELPAARGASRKSASRMVVRRKLVPPVARGVVGGIVASAADIPWRNGEGPPRRGGEAGLGHPAWGPVRWSRTLRVARGHNDVWFLPNQLA